MIDLINSVYYFRLSTEKQASAPQAIKHYVDRGLKAGFRKEQIFYEVDSGTNDSRKIYQNILDRVRKGKIRKVYVPELTRFSRSVMGFEDVMEAFSEAGATLWSLEGTEYKFDTPDAKLALRIQISLAQKEAEINALRSVRGHKYLRDNGIPMRNIFPYKLINGKLEPNLDRYRDHQETCWDVGNFIIDTFIQTANYSKTLKLTRDKFGWDEETDRDKKFVISIAALKKWLKHANIRGHIHYVTVDKSYYNTHTPLVSGDRLQQLDNILSISQQGNKSNVLTNLWKGILYCSCGSKMRVQFNKDHKYITCAEASPSSYTVKNRSKQNRCKLKGSFGLRIEQLTKLSINAAGIFATEIANEMAKGKVEEKLEEPKELLKLREEIKTLENTAKSVSDLEYVIEQKKKQLKNLEASVYLKSDDEDTEKLRLIEFFRDARNIERYSNKELSALFHQAFSKIICHRGEVSFMNKIYPNRSVSYDAYFEIDEVSYNINTNKKAVLAILQRQLNR
ncbi:recombinase family protein [Pleurocapsa sp. PCC 7319]|uniref:recombinase family protein n=1 Tax=Pleurocapsa sp. PCC 7319 TaxID=118161 RepID=UPI000345FF0C|nr:recombinase family protein [Pleurocapsa sp. PCC 7319]